GRPIVAAIDAPATNLSTYLARILNVLITNHVAAHLNSTGDFLESIKDLELDRGMEFASLDVVNLYGSIPVEDHTFPGAISVVSDFFDNFKDECDLKAIEKKDFAALLRLCLTSDTIRINDEHYKQIKGIQMGSNISCSCAIIFMNFVENQILLELGEKIIIWKRYIDDVFLVYKDLRSSEILEQCNDVHPNICFTFEAPVNGELPYLDVKLKIGDKGNKFVTTLYQKPCHSNAVIPWSSHHPRHVKINILKNDIQRAIRNGSDIDLQKEGVKHITSRYSANGYPTRLIRRTLYNARHHENSAETKVCKNNRVFISLPFLNDNAVREIKKTLHKCELSEHVGISFKSNTMSSILRKKEQFCCNCVFCDKNTDKGNCRSKNVVYKIMCALCDSFYIGETSRTMRSRLREHLGVNTSNIYDHLTKAHHVRPDVEHITWSVLHFGVSNYDVRRRVETSEIRSKRPSLNSQVDSVHFS
ncbi:MAG: hypothetical protein AAGK05_13000, partial [Pseudomonadota bacterium]